MGDIETVGNIGNVGIEGMAWIVGRCLWIQEADGTWNWTWDCHGVFSDGARAEALCKDQYWFVLPVVVEQPLPEEPYESPEMIFPSKTLAEPLRRKRSELSAKL